MGNDFDQIGLWQPSRSHCLNVFLDWPAVQPVLGQPLQTGKHGIALLSVRNRRTDRLGGIICFPTCDNLADACTPSDLHSSQTIKEKPKLHAEAVGYQREIQSGAEFCKQLLAENQNGQVKSGNFANLVEFEPRHFIERL